MFRNLLFVMLGGALGSVLRYLTGLCCQSIRWLALPWGSRSVWQFYDLFYILS